MLRTDIPTDKFAVLTDLRARTVTINFYREGQHTTELNFDVKAATILRDDLDAAIRTLERTEV